MPYTTRSDGGVYTASSHNANCRDQVISTVTSATRPSGTEGQVIFETDTDLFQAYTGSGWVPYGGLGGWTSWNPTLSQSAAVTRTVVYARSLKIGRLVICSCNLSITGAGTANNIVTISTPYTAAVASNTMCGIGHIFENGIGNAPGIAFLTTTDAFAFLGTDVAASSTFLGQTPTAFSGAFAAGDGLSMTAIYEAAA